MPTIFTHPVIPIGIASLAGRQNVSGHLLLAGVIASILPDADVIGLMFRIPYRHTMGHRGFSHSIAFALIIGLLGIFTAHKLNASRIVAFLFLFLSTFSHGMLDALTNGSQGIAFLSPFSNERFLFSVAAYSGIAALHRTIFRGQRLAYFSIRTNLGMVPDTVARFFWDSHEEGSSVANESLNRTLPCASAMLRRL